MEEKEKYKSMTLKQLAIRYEVSKPTLRKWLRDYMPAFKINNKTYIFTPEQVKKIIEELG